VDCIVVVSNIEVVSFTTAVVSPLDVIVLVRVEVVDSVVLGRVTD